MNEAVAVFSERRHAIAEKVLFDLFLFSFCKESFVVLCCSEVYLRFVFSFTDNKMNNDIENKETSKSKYQSYIM